MCKTEYVCVCVYTYVHVCANNNGLQSFGLSFWLYTSVHFLLCQPHRILTLDQC